MIWLIRHGESVANVGHATFDYGAIELTARGRNQADAVAAACAEMPKWVGVSPYLRAKQTAEPLLAKYPATQIIELAVQEFTYLASAKTVGMDSANRQPLVDEYWTRREPDYCDGDGAESFASFWRRVMQFLSDTAERDGFGIVYTHEQFIRGVLLATMYPGIEPTAQLMNQFFALRVALPIPNGAIVQLRCESNRWWTGGIGVSHIAMG